MEKDPKAKYAQAVTDTKQVDVLEETDLLPEAPAQGGPVFAALASAPPITREPTVPTRVLDAVPEAPTRVLDIVEPIDAESPAAELPSGEIFLHGSQDTAVALAQDLPPFAEVASTHSVKATQRKRGRTLIGRMLAAMDKWGASDLFVTENKHPAARVHGKLRRLDLPETTAADIQAFLSVLLSDAQQEQFRHTGDLDVGYSLDQTRRFRFNLSRQKGMTGFVVRALPSGNLLFGDLGLPEALVSFCEELRGFILVTGATGSGKSTTLAAMLHYINSTRAHHIVTVEDPIEFVHVDQRSRISQREVGTDTESFHEALRRVVRQSPDVIMIGELRDLDTISVALSAALTGHLVLASLHTIDATQTLQRLLSYFPEHLRQQAAMDLSMSLRGIISQRLVPKKDGKGRAVATELLTATPPAIRLIREQRITELQDLMRSVKEPGMQTFNQSLLKLFRDDQIAHDVGMAYATNPDEFALSAQGMSTGIGMFLENADTDIRANLDMKSLLKIANKLRASDLHLSVGRPPILRIDGDLKPLDVPALTTGDLRLLLFSILSVRQRTTYELEREIDFALALDSDQRFRVNAYYHKGEMAAALRAIPREIPDASTLGLPEILLNLGEQPHGLLLVVGPTGSGKTTTMACLLDRINRSRSCRVITVEDPIEYVHQSMQATIDQREVHADTKSFSAALKYVLRQDPDVIQIGEMRDLETISAALTAAETGHLVMATLHTNDAIQAIDRVIDVFPAAQQEQIRAQLAACLLGVVSQRLLPRKDKQGRVACFEIMVGTPAIRHMIRDNKMHQALSTMETSQKEGMVTIDYYLRELYNRDIITYEAALRYVRNPIALGKTC